MQRCESVICNYRDLCDRISDTLDREHSQGKNLAFTFECPLTMVPVEMLEATLSCLMDHARSKELPCESCEEMYGRLDIFKDEDKQWPRGQPMKKSKKKKTTKL